MIKLTLNVGQHHSAYIDAYYGPEEWQPNGEPIELNSLKNVAEKLLINIKQVQVPKDQTQRKDFLHIQLHSVEVIIRQLLKESLSFEQESVGLYDAISPEVNINKLD